MIIKYENKPTQERIDECINKLEYYLSSFGAKVDIIMYPEPIDIRSYINRIETDSERHWIEGYEVCADGLGVKNLKVRIFDPGILILDGKDLESVLWTEAYMIQSHIYKFLNKNPGNPKDGDRYWDLWNKINK